MTQLKELFLYFYSSFTFNRAHLCLRASVPPRRHVKVFLSLRPAPLSPCHPEGKRCVVSLYCKEFSLHHHHPLQCYMAALLCVCVCVWLFIYMCGVLAWWFHSLCGGQPHILGVMNEHWDINCVSISVCVAVFVSCDLSCFCSLAWLTSAAAVIWTHSAPSACSGGCPAPPVYPHGAFGQWRRRCGRGCSRPSGFSEWSLLLRVDIAPSPAWRMRRRTRLAFAADWAADCAAPLQTENKPIREREGGVNRWRLELFVSKEMLWLHPKAFCAVYSPSPPQSTQERADWLSHIYSWLVKVGKGRSYS